MVMYEKSEKVTCTNFVSLSSYCPYNKITFRPKYQK